MSIYVGNLSFQVTQQDISEASAEYGTVKSVKLPTDRETGRVRGFAFEDLDGAEWMGRTLKVNKARPREDHRGGGNFGGGGRF